MGHKFSTLVKVKEQHKEKWNYFQDESKALVSSLKEVCLRTNDGVLQGAREDFQKEFSDIVTTINMENVNSLIASKMKETIKEDFSNIASIALGEATKKEVKHSFKRTSFESNGQEMCSILLITYVGCQARSRYKLKFSITYAFYQSSLPNLLVNGHHETGSPDQMSDVSSARHSVHSTSSSSYSNFIATSSTAPSTDLSASLKVRLPDKKNSLQSLPEVGRDDQIPGHINPTYSRANSTQSVDVQL